MFVSIIWRLILNDNNETTTPVTIYLAPHLIRSSFLRTIAFTYPIKNKEDISIANEILNASIPL